MENGLLYLERTSYTTQLLMALTLLLFIYTLTAALTNLYIITENYSELIQHHYPFPDACLPHFHQDPLALGSRLAKILNGRKYDECTTYPSQPTQVLPCSFETINGILHRNMYLRV